MADLADLKADDYEVLTFDCYGTIVDWETGILSYLQPILLGHDAHVIDTFLLEFFSETEPVVQAEGGSYRYVLREVLLRLGKRLAFTPSEDALDGFADSVGDWAPFPDSVDALARLEEAFELAVISNTDDDLFARTQNELGIEFSHIVTAEQVGAYKPNPAMFEAAFTRIGRDPSRILHVAQSLYHDIAPAKALGLATVWIDRSQGADGAARSADAVPDWTFPDLASFADAILD